MKVLLVPRPTPGYSVGIFEGRIAAELERRGYRWEGHLFHYLGFCSTEWDGALVFGAARRLSRVLSTGRPVIVTMGKPESREEHAALGREYRPELDEITAAMAEAIVRAPMVAFISKYVEQLWMMHFQEKHMCFPEKGRRTVVYHGVDLNAFAPRAEETGEEFVIGTAGAFREPFRIRILFEISRRLQLPHRLLVVGSLTEECRQELEAQRATKINASSVDWVGWVGPAKLAGYYQQMDCLVHPVDYEGFGIVIAEAMACGVPVVVPSHGAPAEYVRGGGGVVADTRQFVYDAEFCDAFAEGVAIVAKDRQRLGALARSTARRLLGIEGCVDRYLSLLGWPMWCPENRGDSTQWRRREGTVEKDRSYGSGYK